ncbi:MAG: phage major capsid protein [Methylophaga sp.]|uniref:phage major capsid protein n=1 Tax=Methylophaga sp. TaxID=2024840 RepID=UPI000C8B4519|nr:phage major capsid protein [Methylophaga sp.]MBN46868.1 phage major capsid protein [Methylophaga sp.]|tara:strand:+ start:4255 stop:5472 length:1218 start_codon:yes stop_codon:yes gene_type:complete
MDMELKEAIEKIGKTYEEYKKTNDERLSQLEKKGVVDPLVTEKLERLDAKMSELEAVKSAVDSLEKKANRPSAQSSEYAEERAEHKKAFSDFMRKGKTDGLHDIEQKAFVGNSDPDGGYLMTHEMSSEIDRILAQDVAMRRLAAVRTIGGTSWKQAVNVGGAGYGWEGETDEGGETSTPTLKEIEIVPGKIYAEPNATADSLDDAFVNAEAWLSDEVSISFTEGEAAAFITGTGIKSPRGILSYTNVANSSYTWGNIGYTASGAAGAFAASNPSDNLVDLIHTLKRGYRNGASFLMNDLTLSSIRKFKDGQGIYLWTPGLQEGVSSTLLGYGVEIDDNMPDVAANTYSIAFANFSRAYQIVDRAGVAVLRDPYTRKGWVKFYTTKRVGGGVKNFEAIKLMKFATS